MALVVLLSGIKVVSFLSLKKLKINSTEKLRILTPQISPMKYTQLFETHIEIKLSLGLN